MASPVGFLCGLIVPFGLVAPFPLGWQCRLQLPAIGSSHPSLAFLLHQSVARTNAAHSFNEALPSAQREGRVSASPLTGPLRRYSLLWATLGQSLRAA